MEGVVNIGSVDIGSRNEDGISVVIGLRTFVENTVTPVDGDSPMDKLACMEVDCGSKCEDISDDSGTSGGDVCTL